MSLVHCLVYHNNRNNSGKKRCKKSSSCRSRGIKPGINEGIVSHWPLNVSTTFRGKQFSEKVSVFISEDFADKLLKYR